MAGRLTGVTAPEPLSSLVERHRRACSGFGRAVSAADGKWARATPCSEWDARALVEHVIGFHEVLLLKRLGVRAHRPRDDTVERWLATERALFGALEGEAAAPSGAVDVVQLLPILTADVLAHTWDLARAVGADATLDATLCEHALATVEPNDERLRASGMFGARVSVPAGADAQTRLVAFFGRDPQWRP